MKNIYRLRNRVAVTQICQNICSLQGTVTKPLRLSRTYPFFTFKYRYGRPRIVCHSQFCSNNLLYSPCFCSLLPTPVHAPAVSDDDDNYSSVPHPAQGPSQSQSIIVRTVVPPYGQRKGWKPTSQEDYGALTSICRLFSNLPTHDVQVTVAPIQSVM